MTNALTNTDGWVNLLSGLGMKQDKSRYNTFSPGLRLPAVVFSSLYARNGLGSRIVKVVAEDMTKAGFEVNGDGDGKLKKALEDLRWQYHIDIALRWTRLFGGALVVLDIADGGALDTPINFKGTKSPKINGMKVYAAPRVDLQQQDIVTDEKSPYFDQVEIFRVKKRFGGEFKVHESRCLVFHGEASPDLIEDGLLVEDWYWGQSVIQMVYDDLSALGTVLQGGQALAQEFSVAKYRLTNLAQIVSENDFAALNRRMESINACKSVLNAVLLGNGEEYSRDTLTMTGWDTMVDRFFMVLAGVTGIPVTRLFGRSAAGMNASGDGDLQTYYDMVKALQGLQLQPPLLRLCQYVNKSIGTPVKEEELGINFSPVWTPSEKELIGMRKTQAETDQIYINLGVLNNQDVAESRFIGGYSFETSLEELPELPAPPEPETPPPAKPTAPTNPPKAPAKTAKPATKAAPAPTKEEKPQNGGTKSEGGEAK
jgi:uncharacterized protein